MREVYALFLAIDYQVLLHQHKHLQNEYFPNQLRGRSSTAVIQSSGLQESLRSKATEHQILVQKEEQITKAQIAERKALMKKKRQLKKKGENLEAKDVIRLEELEVLFKKMQKAKKRITDAKASATRVKAKQEWRAQRTALLEKQQSAEGLNQLEAARLAELTGLLASSDKNSDKSNLHRKEWRAQRKALLEKRQSAEGLDQLEAARLAELTGLLASSDKSNLDQKEWRAQRKALLEKRQSAEGLDQLEAARLAELNGLLASSDKSIAESTPGWLRFASFNIESSLLPSELESFPNSVLSSPESIEACRRVVNQVARFFGSNEYVVNSPNAEARTHAR